MIRYFIITIIIAMFPALAVANNCRYWEAQINTVDNAKRNGGTGTQMEYWQRQRNYLEEQLSRCKRTPGNDSNKIRVAAGANHNPKKYSTNERFIHSNVNHHQLQQLIKTCNYWIGEHNKKPSPENRAFKDNACRDAKATENRILNPQERVVMEHKRSTKECIKPNNVIDNDVKLCMQGLKEPTWVTVKNN